MRSSDSSVDTDESDHSIIEEKQIDELAPIPTLKELTVRAAIVDSAVRIDPRNLSFTYNSIDALDLETGHVFLR